MAMFNNIREVEQQCSTMHGGATFDNAGEGATFNNMSRVANNV
jgi:hypothetical protein